MDSSTSEDDAASSISSGKKVRFDLNDEVFEIPNKWDRLSTRRAAKRNKLVEEACRSSKGKSCDSTDRRGKSKQNKSKKVKKTSKKLDNKSQQVLTSLGSPSRQVLSLDCSVLSTQKEGFYDKSASAPSKTKKVPQHCSPEVKLKLSHRNSIDVPSNDIVLPKINYSSDLKRAIENAVVRNRVSQQEIDGNLKSFKEHCKFACDFPTYSGKHHIVRNMNLTTPQQFISNPPPSRSSSTEELRCTSRKEKNLANLPEYEPNFSELSRDVESWIPFSTRENNQRKKTQKGDNQPMKSSWMVPSSILY